MRMSRLKTKLAKTRPAKTRPEAETGFSLLEMLIVLAIMGLMLSLVGARSITAIESTRFASTADAGIASIRLLRAEAMLNDMPLHVIGSEAPIRHNGQVRALNLPQGWTVSGDNILISKTGICSGGQLTLQGPSNRRATYALTPPLCEPHRIETP
ncbi:MAG: hypothetical protein COA69_02845 [Robiginitomaculum sp.]|nr:MAG: hypothetical protein COA69_02845 [Robiginitomaculum sp.]